VGGPWQEPLTQGFAALLKPAAFRGLLCAGPPRGRNVTFVAPRRWLTDWAEVDTEEAIDTLALAHLGAYGPAGPDEFARWFDLKPALAKKSFARLDKAGRIAQVDVESTTGSVPADLLDALTAKPATKAPTVVLLPAFDPYVVGSTRRLEQIGANGHKAAVSRPQGWISPTLVVDGWIRGVWEQVGDQRTLTPFARLSKVVRRQLGSDVVVA